MIFRMKFLNCNPKKELDKNTVIKDIPEKKDIQNILILELLIKNKGIKRHSHPALEAVKINSKEIENARRILKINLILFSLSKNINERENGHIKLNQVAK